MKKSKKEVEVQEAMDKIFDEMSRDKAFSAIKSLKELFNSDMKDGEFNINVKIKRTTEGNHIAVHVTADSVSHYDIRQIRDNFIKKTFPALLKE